MDMDELPTFGTRKDVLNIYSRSRLVKIVEADHAMFAV